MNFDDFDVVLVGSGGDSDAWRLATQGLNVFLMGAGEHFDPVQDYLLHLPKWDVAKFPEKAGSQDKYTFAPTQQLDSALADLRSWKAVSGPINQGAMRQPANGGYQYVC